MSEHEKTYWIHKIAVVNLTEKVVIPKGAIGVTIIPLNGNMTGYYHVMFLHEKHFSEMMET